MLRNNLSRKVIAVTAAAGLVLSAVPVSADSTNRSTGQPMMFGQFMAGPQSMPGTQNGIFRMQQYGWNTTAGNGVLPQEAAAPAQASNMANPLQRIADELDIDTDDMSISEIAEAILEQLDELSADELDSVIKILNLDSESLDEDDIIEKAEERIDNILFFEGLKDVVDTLDISASGKSLDSLLDAITAELDDLDTDELETVAEELGIDTDDLEKDEIIDSIEALFEDFDAVDADNTLELVTDLLGIDTDDLSDSEIVDSAMDELDEISLDKLMQISRMLKVDMSGSTYSELIEKAKAALKNLE